MKPPISLRAPFRFMHVAPNDGAKPPAATSSSLSLNKTARKLTTRAQLACVMLLGLCGAAQAHEGHGLPGTHHWHSTDVWGFIVVGGLVALVIWMRGRK